MDAQLKKGLLEVCVLSVLREGRAHGRLHGIPDGRLRPLRYSGNSEDMERGRREVEQEVGAMTGFILPLRTCNRCGHRTAMLTMCEDAHGRRSFRVVCDDCGRTLGMHPTAQDAADEWNARWDRWSREGRRPTSRGASAGNGPRGSSPDRRPSASSDAPGAG